MTSSFSNEHISSKFNAYNDMLENILGFDFLFDYIVKEPNIEKILDFGCGPGKVSERLSKINNKYRILAVDESENMLKIANKKRKNNQIEYRLINNDNLEFIKSNSIDCAIECFVMINNSSKERIYKAAKEVFRVLKDGGLFIILDSNPNAAGIEFSTFTNGDKKIKYKCGDRKKQFLKIPNNSDLILEDYYWTKEFYLELLRQTGFTVSEIIEPSIKDIQKDKLLEYEKKYNYSSWKNELDYAPFIIFKSYKI